MASKKRPTKKRSDFASKAAYDRYKKRSAAAKKAHKAKVERIAAAKRYVQTNVPKAPIRGLEESDKHFIKRQEQHFQALMNYIEAERVTQDFVDYHDIAMLRKDNFAIAMQPSRLRHLGAVTDEMEKMLERAAQKGKRALRKQAKEYAEFFNVPLREVYTLFFSP